MRSAAASPDISFKAAAKSPSGTCSTSSAANSGAISSRTSAAAPGSSSDSNRAAWSSSSCSRTSAASPGAASAKGLPLLEIRLEVVGHLLRLASCGGEKRFCELAWASESKSHFWPPERLKRGVRLLRVHPSYGRTAVTFTVKTPAGASYETSSPAAAPINAEPSGLVGEAKRRPGALFSCGATKYSNSSPSESDDSHHRADLNLPGV